MTEAFPDLDDVLPKGLEDAEWQTLCKDMRQVFRIHRALMQKLLKDDRPPPLELSVALESFANRYLDFADEISGRWRAVTSEVEEGSKAGIGGPSVAPKLYLVGKPRV